MYMQLLKARKQEKNEEYNPAFIAAVQPQGGATFKHEKYVSKGSVYETCLHVYKYPTEPGLFWLNAVMGIQDVIVKLDIASIEKADAKEQIGYSLDEYLNRAQSEKKDGDKKDAVLAYQDMEELFLQISKGHEVMKKVHLRIYVTASTVAELEKKVENIQLYIEGEGFQADVFANEQKLEYQAKFASFDEQDTFRNRRYGQPIPAKGLGLGVPFNALSLKDKGAHYWGETRLGGSVLWNMCYKDKWRKSFDCVVIGKKGAGKSITLNKMSKENIIKGNKIRTFDVNGEHSALALEYDGKVISMDGTGAILNVLEIFKSAVGNDQCYALHDGKVRNFYKQLKPEAKTQELDLLTEELINLYTDWGLWSDDLSTIQITNRATEDYPIFSDFLAHIQRALYSDIEGEVIKDTLSERKRTSLESIEGTLKTLVKTYGKMFNGHSNLSNIEDEQIVVFDMQNVVDMDSTIFNAQLFNVLYLIWRGMFHTGRPQWLAHLRGELDIRDVEFYIIIIDEAHHTINVKNPDAVKQLKKFSREARKYFAGLVFATQNITDFVPLQHADSDAEAIRDIVSLLEMSEYKMIMEQDPNSLEILRRIFGKQLSASELDAIPLLSQGECILCLSTNKNIRFHIYVSDADLRTYGGNSGAGQEDVA
ncbi:type VI secretion protein [Listeria booriae]|nr:type VI secretion protein [Listeria booriae]